MDNVWLLYWITRLDAITALLKGIFVISAAFPITFLVTEKEFTKAAKVSTAVAFVSVLFVTLIPSKEDALMIAGGVVLTEIVQSEAAGRLASKSVLVVESWLDNNIPKEEKK